MERELSSQDQSFIKAIMAYIKSDIELYNRYYTNEFFDLLNEIERDVHADLQSGTLVLHVLYTRDNDINKLILFYLNYYLDKEIDELYYSLNPIISEENVSKIFNNLEYIIHNHEMRIDYSIDEHFVLLMKLALRGKENLEMKESDNEMEKYNDAKLSVTNESNIYPVKLNDKWGFAKANFVEVIPCRYDNAYPFVSGLAMVKLNNKYGFINEAGKEVVSCIYDYIIQSILRINNKKISFAKLDGKIGFIDRDNISVFNEFMNKIINIGSDKNTLYFQKYDDFYLFSENGNSIITLGELKSLAEIYKENSLETYNQYMKLINEFEKTL